MMYPLEYAVDVIGRNRLWTAVFISLIAIGGTVIPYISKSVDNLGGRYLDLVRFDKLSIRGPSIDEGPDDAPQYNERKDPCIFGNPCNILIVADLDRNSKVDDGYQTLFGEGVIYQDQDEWKVDWAAEPFKCVSPYNEGGRGMELSELVIFNGSMYAFDDRTGIIFEVTRDARGEYEVYAKHILTEGDGVSSSKGMKIEWATTKDNMLWIGSFGKEYTKPDGSIKNYWPLWVAAADANMHIRRKDWTDIYTKLRDITGATYPGYLLHEAVVWSPLYRQWIICPRRWSDESYDEVLDNSKGSNKMIICSESFMDCKVVTIGEIRPKRGYSSVKIVPDTDDQILIALKSEEEDQVENNGGQNTYIQIFDKEGHVLMDDLLVPYKGKFEGIEFYADV